MIQNEIGDIDNLKTKHTSNQDDEINQKAAVMAQGLGAMAVGMANLVKNLIDNDEESREIEGFLTPHLHSVSFKSEAESEDQVLLKFSYVRAGKVYAVALPFYTSLPRVVPRVEINGVYPTIYSEPKSNEDSFLQKAITLMYKPLIMLGMGALATFNIFGAYADILKAQSSLGVANTIISNLMRVSTLNLFGLGVAILYFGGRLFYHYLNNNVRKQLENEFEKIKELQEDIHNILKVDARLRNLGLFFHIVLNPNFPDNNYLRWRYYFLRGFDMFGNENGHRKALRISHDPHKRFKILDVILGIANFRFDSMLMDMKDRFYERNERINPKTYVEKRIEYDNDLDMYVNDIPTEIEEHKNLYSDLEQKLNDCLKLFEDFKNDNSKFESLRTAFDRIELDGYSRIAFPNLTIIYHQIKLFILLYKPLKPHDGSSSGRLREIANYCDKHFNIKLAAEYLRLIEASIIKYYPEKAQEYKYFVAAFNKFADMICNQRPTLESELKYGSLRNTSYENFMLRYQMDRKKSQNMFWSFMMSPDGKLSDTAPEVCHSSNSKEAVSSPKL